MLPIEKDELAPSGVVKTNKVEPSRKTWFFERPDGSIFGCQQVEAWQTLLKHNAHTRDFKFIGCSDGMTFQRAVLESQKVFKETGDFAKAQEVLRQGERDEIEKARGNLEYPPDPTVVTTKRSP
jgi:hypothetical protein